MHLAHYLVVCPLARFYPISKELVRHVASIVTCSVSASVLLLWLFVCFGGSSMSGLKRTNLCLQKEFQLDHIVGRKILSCRNSPLRCARERARICEHPEHASRRLHCKHVKNGRIHVLDPPSLLIIYHMRHLPRIRTITTAACHWETGKPSIINQSLALPLR